LRELRCDFCDMSYHRNLRSDLGFQEAQVIARSQHEEGKRAHYSRGTILGMMHERKMELWTEHVTECEFLLKEEKK